MDILHLFCIKKQGLAMRFGKDSGGGRSFEK
jgi:hypothetical protein